MKKKILVIILIILNIFLLIHGNRETEKYIIQDDYKFILSYPLIKNKKIDLKINNFVEENKKIYNQNSDNIKSMIALIEYDGIGLKTMQNCFRVVMNYQDQLTLNL